MKNGIEFYEDVLENPEDLISIINNHKWSKVGNVNYQDRSNSVIYFNERNQEPRLFDTVDSIFSKTLEDYRAKYHIPKLKYWSIEALRYQPGEKYVMHFDNGSRHVAHRIVSTVIYLNDNYEGGEIEFTNFDIKVKPKKSSMAIFPSNYPYMHIAHEVKSGTRYALNIFTEYE